MAAKALVQARIDGSVKEEAAAVLASMGLTVSDAVRLLLTKVAKEHALPFDPLIPNAETVEAMKAARRGKVTSFKSVDELMADLNADASAPQASLPRSASSCRCPCTAATMWWVAANRRVQPSRLALILAAVAAAISVSMAKTETACWRSRRRHSCASTPRPRPTA